MSRREMPRSHRSPSTRSVDESRRRRHREAQDEDGSDSGESRVSFRSTGHGCRRTGAGRGGEDDEKKRPPRRVDEQPRRHHRDQQDSRVTDMEILTLILDYSALHYDDRVTVGDLAKHVHQSTRRVLEIAGKCPVLVVQDGEVAFIDSGRQLRICSNHLENGCYDTHCTEFHICPDFLLDECADPSCTKVHRLERHNRKILERLGLRGVPDVTLSGILASVLRTECQQYNQRSKLAANLRSSVTLNPPGGDMPQAVRRQQQPVVQQQQQQQPARPRPPPFNDQTSSQKAQICVRYLKDNCQEPCPQGELHAPRPYQWQVEDPATNSWYNFHADQNEELETSYRVPACDKLDLNKLNAIMRGMPDFARLRALLEGQKGSPAKTWQADFEAMQLVDTSDQSSGPLMLRRLSTPSIVTSEDMWATRWNWFFKDKNGHWIEYGLPAEENESVFYRSDKESLELEAAYRAYQHENGPGTVPFATEAHTYDVSLDTTPMSQKNLKTGMRRPIRRRPRAFTQNQDNMTFFAGQNP